MKTRLTKYPLSLIALLLTILFFSCVVPTKQPSYFDSHPDVLKKQYTADEITILEKNFKANPLQYSQAVGDMLLWQMYQKSPEFAIGCCFTTCYQLEGPKGLNIVPKRDA